MQVLGRLRLRKKIPTSRPAWSALWVLDQLRLYSDTLSHQRWLKKESSRWAPELSKAHLSISVYSYLYNRERAVMYCIVLYILYCVIYCILYNRERAITYYIIYSILYIMHSIIYNVYYMHSSAVEDLPNSVKPWV